MQALKEQSYREFEIVVVDSGSLDATRDIAAAYADRVLRIDSRDFSFGYSLNIGIRAATGDRIAMISAHTLPTDHEWLSTLVEPLSDERIAMVYGRQIGAPASKFSDARDLRRIFGTRREVLLPPRFFANNANSAIRRDLWKRHPFDETLPGLEDVEWAKYWMETGQQVLYEPDAALYHIHEESWRQVRRRYYREGVAAKRVGVKGSRSIPLEVLREGVYLAQDATHAAMTGQLLEKSKEIAMFRYNKTIGTVRGLWDGAAIDQPRKRETLFFDRTYQAVVVHKPGRASLDEVELPPVKPGDVVIKVSYVGVGDTDQQVLDGTLGPRGGDQPRYPIVPGHEFAGKVVDTGLNIEHVSEGDAAVAEYIHDCGECEQCQRSNPIGCTMRKEVGVKGQNGAYAEYVVLPGRFVHRLPEGIDLRKACLCEPLAVVLKGLKRLERPWTPGKQRRCAVVGSGTIGNLCARVLALQGHHVTVFDSDPIRRGHFQGSGIQFSEDLALLSSYKVVVDATEDRTALDPILQNSAPRAAVLLLGLHYSRQELDLGGIVANDKTIVGSIGAGAQDFQAAIEMLPKLQLDPLIGTIFPLKEFQRASDSLKAGKHLKVLLEVDARLNRSEELSRD